MLSRPKKNNIAGTIGLTGILFVLTYLIIGFYYETNDDKIITLLLRGIISDKPQSNFYLYFHGISQVLVWLYELAPDWPWYGFFLYILLWIALVYSFFYLQNIHSKLTSWQLAIIFSLFFIFIWLENVYWFNYVRVSILLAGGSFLYLILNQVKGQVRYPSEPIINATKKLFLFKYILAGLFFCLAICIRPNAAILGILIVLPAVFLFRIPDYSKLRKLYILFYFIGLLGFTLGIISISQFSENTSQYQKLDLFKSTILDYEIYLKQPRHEQDILLFTSISHWFLADKAVLNESFYNLAGDIRLSYILQEVVWQKIPEILKMLIQDHFLVIAVNIFMIVLAVKARKKYLVIGYQLYFWLLVLLIGVFLKLPPRLITPILCLYTLVNMGVICQIFEGENLGSVINIMRSATFEKNNAIKFKWVNKILIAFFLVLIILQIYKITHRAIFQHERQLANEAVLSKITQSFSGTLIITPVLPDYFRALSPFRNYNFGTNKILPLTGWHTLDLAYQNYYQNLTGKQNYADAVYRLAQQQNVRWILPKGFYCFLNQYFRMLHGRPLQLIRSEEPELYGLDLELYKAQHLVKPESNKIN